jgi:hypothetical protein
MPLGLLGFFGLAGFSLWAAKYRPWFIGLAFIFLIAGSIQLYRGRKACNTRTKGSVITFWVAVGLVLFIFLFPQVVASVLARLS